MVGILILFLIGSVSAIDISTCQQLQRIGLDSDKPLNGNYVLINDIDCSGVANFIPIGNCGGDYSCGNSGDKPFTGTFNGNKHKISSVYYRSSTRVEVGFFGYVENARIYDLGIENIDIGYRNYYVGALAGFSRNSIIERCYAIGKISYNNDVAGSSIGGLVGIAADSQIRNCYSRTDIYAGGDGTFGGSANYLGGFSGYFIRNNIENNYAAHKLYRSNGIASAYNGGFAGFGGGAGTSSNNIYISNYWDGTLSGINNDIGYLGLDDVNIGKETTTQMKQQSKFLGWDFTNIWKIDSGDYPSLWAPVVCTPNCVSRECGDGGCGDATECGICVNEHGATTCSAAGNCEPICDADWGNCDADNKNGCETDLTTETNCGICGEICNANEFCISGVCSNLANVYWANMIGEEITTADIGDSVSMVYENAPSTYNFEIKEDDALTDQDIRVGTNSIAGIFGNGKTIGKWTITEADMIAGGKPELLDGNNNLEFYFTVNGKQSDILKVGENNYTNSPPTAVIINPLDNARYKIGNLVNFRAEVTDEDDELNVNWDFGDGDNTFLQNCFPSGNCNTTHSYSSQGTMRISLTAEEAGRHQKARDNRRIFIYQQGVNPFPVITLPPLNAVLVSGLVNFDASDSFVAKCDSSCPAALPYPSSVCYNVDNLQCYDFDNSLGIPDDYNLWFNWTFSDGREIKGNWAYNYNNVVEFQKYFISPVEHWAKLKLGYECSQNC